MKDFIANIFELWGASYFGDFSKYMYKADLYGEVALVCILLPLIVFFIYHIVIDHIKSAKTSVWICVLLVVSLLSAFIAYNISDSGIGDYIDQHGIMSPNIIPVDYFWFSFIVFIYTAILSLVFSMIFKKGASKTRRIPF